MRNLINTASLGVMLFAAACTATQISTFETDASAVIADVQAAVPLIAAVPGVPGWFVADMTLATNGLSAILVGAQKGSTVEAMSLSGATAAVVAFRAALPMNATVQTDAGLAETALAALTVTQTAEAKIQAFTTLAALALAVEQVEQPTSGAMGAVSPVGALVADGHAHLADMGGVVR